jgi:hypothetical protein
MDFGKCLKVRNLFLSLGNSFAVGSSGNVFDIGLYWNTFHCVWSYIVNTFSVRLYWNTSGVRTHLVSDHFGTPWCLECLGSVTLECLDSR